MGTGTLIGDSHIATEPHSYIATKETTKRGRPLGRPPFVEAARGRLLCGYVAMWLCSSVAMQLCGYMAVWLCSYVAMWLSKFQIFKSANFEISEAQKCGNTGLPNKMIFLRSQISQIHISQGCSHIFLYFLKYFGSNWEGYGSRF